MNKSENDLIVHADLDGLITYANQAYCDAFGLNIEKIVGYDFKKLIHPDDIGAVRDSLRLLETPPHITHHEERARTVNGWKWFAWTVRADIDTGGKIAGIKAVGRDITLVKQKQEKLLLEKKQIEKVLKIGEQANKDLQLESVLKNILEGTTDALNASIGMIFLRDNSTGYLSWGASVGLSEAFITNYKERMIQPGEGLTGRIAETGQPIFIQADSSHDPRIARPIIETEAFNSFIGIPIYALKEIVGVMNILTRSPDILSENDLSLCAAIGTNVGMAIRNSRLYEKIKEAKEALEKSERKYRSMMESLIDPTFICSGKFIVDYMNPAMIDWIGHNAAGGTCYKEIYGFDEQCQWCDMDKILAGEVLSEEFISPKDGKNYLVTSIPINNADGTVSKLTIFRDITDFKKLMDNMQQAQKLESIATLAGGIAHDFNNMLGVITGNVSYVINNLEDDEDLKDALKDVQESVKQGTDLTRQLITFARGGAPVKTEVRLNDLIKDAAKLVLRGSPSKCNFDLAEDLWTVEADAGQINQILSNLIINANQAMPEGGTIRIETNNQTISEGNHIILPPGPYASIKISDQGTGISEKDLPNIFNPFFTTKQDGVGLGLTTSFSIIKRHGGQISVESELNKGTAFTIYLPATGKTIDRKEAEDATSHKGRGKILIMDDQQPVLKMAGRMMGQMGYRAVLTSDGEEAIQAYKEAFSSSEPFDLVILDLTVPGGKGGVKTISELLKIDPGAKAIVSSGYYNDPVMSDYKEYGFCGVLPKPYTKSELSNILNQHFRADK